MRQQEKAQAGGRPGPYIRCDVCGKLATRVVAFAAASPPVECAMSAEKRMNAERICFCLLSTLLAWACATIPVAIAIRIASSAPRL